MGPVDRARSGAAAMLDLGASFLASVARDPDALAIVDGDVRLTYSAWYERISALVAGLDALGLEGGDHLVTVLQNRCRRRRSTGRASSPGSSSRHSIGAPPPTSSISASTTPRRRPSSTRRSPPRPCGH